MKRIALFLFLILSAITCLAQTQIDPTYQIQWNLLSGSGAPSITCTQNGNYTVYPYGAEWGQSYQDTTNNVEYKCTNSGWVENLPTTGGTLTGNLNVTGTLAAESTNNILYADAFPGSTVDLKIAAAFASVAGTSGNVNPSAEVDLSPGKTYTINGTITIPNNLSSPYIFSPTLDCKGSTILYTGSGSAVNILPENVLGPLSTGSLRNCDIYGPTVDSGSPVVVASSRSGFYYYGDILANGSSCLDLENTTTNGGIGYTEQITIYGLTTSACSSHILMHTGTGALSSFEYNHIQNWKCQLAAEKCLDLGTSGTVAFDTQGLVLDMEVNTTSPVTNAYSVYIDNNNRMIRGTVNIRGENTGGAANFYSVFINSPSSYFYNQGNVIQASGVIGYGVGVSEANYVLHPSLQYTSNDLGKGSSIHYEPETGIYTPRHCKYDLGGGGTYTNSPNATFWLARFAGSEDDCNFQILSRTTTAAAGDNDVDISGSGVSAVNDFYVDALSGNVGIGSGYGNGYPSGSIVPPANLSVNGTEAHTGIGVNGIRYTPIANTGGNIYLYGTNSSNSVATWGIDELGSFYEGGASNIVIPSTAAAYKGSSTGGPLLVPGVHGTSTNNAQMSSSAATSGLVSFDTNGNTTTTQITGTVSAPTSGTAVTIFASPADNHLYLVLAYVGNDWINYSASAYLYAGSSTCRIVSNNGPNLTLTLSSCNVQSTQSSGLSQTISYTYVQLE